MILEVGDFNLFESFDCYNVGMRVEFMNLKNEFDIFLNCEIDDEGVFLEDYFDVIKVNIVVFGC